MINADEFRRNPFTSLALGDLEKEALVSPDGLVVARRVNDPNEPRDSYVKIYTGLWSGGFESFTQAMLALPELLAENERMREAIEQARCDMRFGQSVCLATKDLLLAALGDTQ
jgi:hypothetical protein